MLLPSVKCLPNIFVPTLFRACSLINERHEFHYRDIWFKRFYYSFKNIYLKKKTELEIKLFFIRYSYVFIVVRFSLAQYKFIWLIIFEKTTEWAKNDNVFFLAKTFVPRRSGGNGKGAYSVSEEPTRVYHRFSAVIKRIRTKHVIWRWVGEREGGTNELDLFGFKCITRVRGDEGNGFEQLFRSYT